MSGSPKQARITLAQVAEAAGVSIGTASNVLNGRPYVRQRVRDRVLQAAQELGYRPNAIAEALATGRHKMLTLCAFFAENPIAAEIIQGASSATQSAQYGLTICALGHGASLQPSHIEAILRQQAAAVVVFTYNEDPAPYLELQSLGIPVVFINRRPSGIDADLIMVDARQGTYDAVSHLLGRGRRRVALFTRSNNARPALDRIAGYREAHARMALGVPEGLIRTGLTNADEAYRATEELLCLPQPPDAIFAGSATFTALGVLTCLQDHRVRIPADIAVIVAGDMKWVKLVEPPLTMVEEDFEGLGRRAAEIALSRLDPRRVQESVREVQLAVQLVVRGSS
ncbi:MAG: LacI family DNA-binding transcriptional regulator [Dehalococcoidales bacterium]|nr:LacI family DNA-binding transcriptional regulator [Dehalococcoidales bacterium]